MNRPRITRPEVLHSAAGYYIGRLYYNSDGLPSPYLRESGYYETEEAAQRTLDEDDYYREEPRELHMPI